jgi:protein ImuB
MNRAARQKGAESGMTRMEAEAVGGLHLMARSSEVEAAARAVLLECAANFSPRIEDASQGMACACVLDIAGTERLFGPPEVVAARLREALAEAGFRVTIAVSGSFHAARLKAAATRGVTVIAGGEEAAALARLPVAALDAADELAETFAQWGIRTIGELAALPEVELVARLGQRARRWRALAMGAAEHAFQPMEPVFALKEFCDFETPVEQMESLLFVGARMVDCLAGRAAGRALSLASVTLQFELEGGRVHRRVIRPALPTVDRKFLLKLMQLDLAAHPPQAAVVAMTMTAEAGYASKVQLGLFAPQVPEPSRLDVTIARLKAIAGEDRVGSPVLEDSHQPGRFRMEGFGVAGPEKEAEAEGVRMALRRLRPALPVRVVLRSSAPAIFHDGRRSYIVEQAFGPWRSSGCWWALGGWDAEEWDVLAEPDGGAAVACLLVLDRGDNTWRLEAFYD